MALVSPKYNQCGWLGSKLTYLDIFMTVLFLFNFFFWLITLNIN